MRSSLPALFASIAVGSTLWSGEARANGRFPESNAVFFSEADPNLVLLRVTFGLMVSHDRGATWDWACEQSIGVTGVEDPMFTVTPSGAYVASTFLGMSVSHNQGCSFDFVGGAVTDLTFIDLTTRKAEPGRIVSFASAYDHQDDEGNIVFKSELWESKDEAASFVQLGPSLDPTLLGQTVDLTESDPNRIYVSADRNPTVTKSSVLLTSRDRGASWEENAIPLQGAERSAFIAAVDPTNADRVYVRTLSIDDGTFDGGASPPRPSRLLLSDDAGKTWRTIFQAQSLLSGFALAPDGSKVYVGGPKDGIQVASTTDFVFTQTSTQEVGCLALAADGLWTCSNERSGFVLGLTKDDGKTFESKLHFCDIRGALACPPDTEATAVCAPVFPTQYAVLGCAPFPESDAGSVDGGAGGSSGAPGADPGATDDGGCSCTVGPSSPYATFAGSAVAVGAGLAFVARRARRRSRR